MWWYLYNLKRCAENLIKNKKRNNIFCIGQLKKIVFFWSGLKKCVRLKGIEKSLITKKNHIPPGIKWSAPNEVLFRTEFTLTSLSVNWPDLQPLFGLMFQGGVINDVLNLYWRHIDQSIC